jgi:hypothetical protein
LVLGVRPPIEDELIGIGSVPLGKCVAACNSVVPVKGALVETGTLCE